MLEQQKTFGEALAEWMRASGVSAKRLAERTGYKSKTSIVRILREEGVHAGRERLLEQLRKQDLLDPAAYASLAQALEISRVGPTRARGRMCLRRLLCLLYTSNFCHSSALGAPPEKGSTSDTRAYSP